MADIWLPVLGYEGAYEVSNTGLVRSIRGAHRQGKVLKGVPAGVGYLTVTLCVGGVTSKRYVHHLVAAAFIGPRPDRLDVCHSNGDMLDNRLANLRYDTRNANMRDCIAHGTHRGVAKTHCAKGHELTPDNTKVVYSQAVDGGQKSRRRCRTCLQAKSRRDYLNRKVAA